MQKIKSPWYGVVWIVIWTAALIWFHQSGMFTTREMAGIFIVWLVMVGITVHLLYRHHLLTSKQVRPEDTQPAEPSRNAPCPCGSGKKYKRCCGAESERRGPGTAD